MGFLLVYQYSMTLNDLKQR